jgi:hypothetical protein
MASSDRLRARDTADAEHSPVILERTLMTLGFNAVFSRKQLESNVNGDSTPQAPTEWIMHARVRQTPGLLPGECGYDATSWARYADKVGVKMEDRKRKIQAEDGEYLCVGIVDGEIDKAPILAVNSRTGKRRQFELSTFARSHENEVASGDSMHPLIGSNRS